MGKLLDIVSGIPGAVGQAMANLAQQLEGIQDDMETMGESDIDVAGPEKETEGYADVGGDETGQPAQRRRVRYTTRKAETKKLKQASPAVKTAANAIDGRVKRLESDFKALGQAFKQKGMIKSVGTGNRAIFAATVAGNLTGATLASGNVVANAATYYDRVGFVANVPSLITTVRAAGNQVVDGSDQIACDAGQFLGPFEMAEPIQLAGTSGASFTHINRGAGTGDASVVFVPTGHSFGSANPAAF